MCRGAFVAQAVARTADTAPIACRCAASSPTKSPVQARSLFSRFIARLSVSRKLMLIYVLDLSAVIFVSYILINEKYIAIDFARKEVQGNAYIAALREPLLDVARSGAGDTAAHARLAAAADAVARAEAEHGSGMGSTELANRFAERLRALATAAPVAPGAPVAEALTGGHELVTRVANQSNLILDPDLDSYYTMSLLALRYPELLQVARDLANVLVVAGPQGREVLRTQHLIAEGRLDAVMSAVRNDHAEAYAAGGPPLREALAPSEAALLAALNGLRQAVRERVGAGASPGAAAEADTVMPAWRLTLDRFDGSWRAAELKLDRLLHQRIERLFERMALHLGTALALLLAILATVTFVARQIARPLKHLSGVADRVRTSGDHGLRAQWDSQDEIGHLVQAFNEMLAQLGHERELQKELAASARAAEAQRELVQGMPIALVVTAIPGHEVLHANPPAEAWLAGRRADPWRQGLEPAVRARFFQQLADRGAVDEFEVRWLLGAEPAWAVLSARRVRFQGQDAVLTGFVPINHLKLMERRLALWAKVFQASGEAIVIVDADRRVLTINDAFTRHTGFELGELVGERPLRVFGDALFAPGAPLWQALSSRGSWQGELALRRRDGSEYPAWVMVSAVRQSQGDVSHCIFTSIDITDRKASEQRIRFLAEHDVLTELPNRALATERLRQALQLAARSGRQVAVLFIDLDRFKHINDSLGHHVGDELLRSVARRLVQAVRAGDTVSRLGGDEFVVVLAGVDGADEVAQIVHQRLIPCVREPHAVGGAALHVSCSVGIAVYPDDAGDLDTLMRHADTAMYEAKAAGRDAACFFAPEMTERAQARLRLEARLRLAHEQGALSLHWQPRVAAQGGAVRGVEGLLRWTDAELGAIRPAEFVPIAEETGLIVPIGAWVIDQACAQIAAWRGQGLPAFGVSINLSARQLGDPGLVDTVREALQRHGVPPSQLELELTESVVMERGGAHHARIQALRELGVAIAIDDFGTGYSSLAYLTRLPCDRVKIDRSFVHDLMGDANARAIVRAIVGLGHTLGLTVVAEGVEREPEAALLREAGCDELQGYLYARPMPAPDLVAWLRQYVPGGPALPRAGARARLPV